LGIVLYERVTVQRTFDADSLQGICTLVLSSTPLPPSHANHSLPAAFDDIAARCLAKDPAHRYANAEALAQQLFPLARHTPLPGHAVQDHAKDNGTGLRYSTRRYIGSP